VTALEAKRYLSDANPSWKAFWCYKGPVVKSVVEMSMVLPKMSKATFEHHVSAAKNDLARWVKEVIGDAELSRRIMGAKTQQMAADALAKRVRELQDCLAVAPEKKTAKKKLKA